VLFRLVYLLMIRLLGWLALLAQRHLERRGNLGVAARGCGPAPSGLWVADNAVTSCSLRILVDEAAWGDLYRFKACRTVSELAIRIKPRVFPGGLPTAVGAEPAQSGAYA
jgi:hypothetical protein